MSILEPRCLVCGAPLGKGAPFWKSARESEVCSDKCYKVFTLNADDDARSGEEPAEEFLSAISGETRGELER